MRLVVGSSGGTQDSADLLERGDQVAGPAAQPLQALVQGLRFVEGSWHLAVLPGRGLNVGA
jgi:hypothetical protein